MAPIRSMRNILMELRKVCQHPYLHAPELENEELPDPEQHRQLIDGCGKISFLKLLLPKLKERGHRVLLFSQFKIALDRIEDFLVGEGYRFLRLDGDVQQAQRQKSMDAFNAPDSDFFIFLLTTRAGGVGINLATADTVIVYDPDFNPHMDLQAIARSHRYGQKKRVLVFKLMTKNSVEEQIILSGKKKMVLDHLVVQQMGKENDEGEIDNILLHGAAALYDTNADGTSASDIRYTSKDVDDLIDKVEADAEAEAKAVEERDKATVDGLLSVEPAKAKETMSFGFAKIWEADQNRLKEIEEAEADDRPEDDDAWLTVMQNVEKARLAAMQAENGHRLRRQAAAKMKYGTDGVLSDTSPSNLKKKRHGNKKKPTYDSSDADFALQSDVSDSDDSVTGVIGLDELIDEQGDPTVRGLAAGVRGGMTKKQIKAVQMAQAAQRATVPGNGANTVANNLNAPSHSAIPSSSQARPNETPEQRAARKARRKEEKRAAKRAEHEKLMRGDGDGAAVTIPPRPPMAHQSSSGHASAQQVRAEPSKIEQGQHVLQWLYHVLVKFGLTDDLQAWARMALPELAANERRAHYFSLARKVDGMLYAQGQRHYFTNADQYHVVLPVLTTGAPVIPESLDPKTAEMPPLTKQMCRIRSSHVPQPTVHRKQSERHMPSPYQSPPIPPARKVPIVPPSQRVTSSSDFEAAPIIAAPAQPRPEPPQPSEPLDNLSEALSQPVCGYCKGPHRVLECDKLPTERSLNAARLQVLNGTDNAQQKAHRLAQIDNILATVRKPRSSAGPQPQVFRSTPVRQEIPRPVPGSKDAAIIVDDDDDDEPAAKRARTDARPSSVVGRGGSTGCPVCGASDRHPLAACPQVLAGTGSIKLALKRFEPRDPVWTALKGLYEASGRHGAAASNQLCLICGRACGKNIRGCITDKEGGDAAGRKALKGKIREIEELRDDPGANPARKQRAVVELEELFDVYLAWPK